MSTSTRSIRFFHRGAIRTVQDLAPTTTVLEWLREHAHCTGSKEGCAEGDCGACTVLLGELDAAGQLQLRNVNACTQFLPSLDGQALLTVEDLGSSAAPVAVQQAMVDCHASQCGFCTPGIVISLQACLERHCDAGTRPSRQQLADDLAGNLCRCTGYRPILDAGQRMFELPAQRLDGPAIAAGLKKLQSDTSLHYVAANPAQPSQEASEGRSDHFHAPRSVAELAELRATKPQALLLSGGTDIGLWHNKQFRDLGDIIYIGQVAELRQIRAQPFEGRPGLWIGAGASLEAAWAALAELAPHLRELWLRFASPPVRQAGTLGGNIANGSPIGDGAPALIALGADIVLRSAQRGQRRLPLQDFYLGYQQKDLAADEFVEALHLPRPTPDLRIQAYKISKRYDSDISAVCAVLALRLDDEARVAEARFAFGGMAAIVKRAARAEAAILGQAWNEVAVKRAAQALAQDFQPLSDLRASSAYRLRVAQNLLHKLWLATRPDEPLKTPALNVWQAQARGEA